MRAAADGRRIGFPLFGGGFLKERESVRLVFQPEHAHSGPWKETKGSQGQARLENEGHVIDQTLPGCSCGGEGGEQKGGTLLLLLPLVLVVVGGGLSCNTDTCTQSPCVHRNALCALRTTRRESLWCPVGECGGGMWGFGGGKYLPPGIITGPLLVTAWSPVEPD